MRPSAQPAVTGQMIPGVHVPSTVGIRHVCPVLVRVLKIPFSFKAARAIFICLSGLLCSSFKCFHSSRSEHNILLGILDVTISPPTHISVCGTVAASYPKPNPGTEWSASSSLPHSHTVSSVQPRICRRGIHHLSLVSGLGHEGRFSLLARPSCPALGLAFVLGSTPQAYC